MLSRANNQRGFSLIELLVVIAILGSLLVLLGLSIAKQAGQGADGRRKSDFARLKIAFEDYYNDKGCYPPPSLMLHCGSKDLSPWLANVLCDPQTHQPYGYYVDSSCKWYALFTTLIDTSDPQIKTLSCFPTCGIANQTYNFMQTNAGADLNTVVTNINGGGAGPTPTPAPTGTSAYACDTLGNCNYYFNPAANGCPVTFQDPATCQAACSTVSNRCTR